MRRIGIAYDLRDLPMQITSYGNPTPGQQGIVNQVRLEYNAFGLLAADYQEHAGAVNLSSSPKVGYIYSDGSANQAHRTVIVYPNGRVLLYEYDSGIDDCLNRITRIAEDAGSGPGSPLTEYDRLGLGRVVRVSYPEGELRADLAHGATDVPYVGLDQFGRVADLRWWNTSTGGDVERVKHGYRRIGNRAWRECPVATAIGGNLDELYGYDGLDQLVTLDRGRLNEGRSGLVSNSKNFAESWGLDPTGNWTRYSQDTNGDGTWDLDQSRTQNAANEIVTLAGSSEHVMYDRVGNMAQAPRPGDWNAHLDLTYDAWNRLVRVSDGATNQTVAEYEYDGRHHRTLTKTYSDGVPSETRHYYYSDRWQVLEERLSEADSADRQYVWGLRYIDDLVLRDRDSMGYATLDERLYALQDPNWNVTALWQDGEIVERYRYSAFGVQSVFTGAFDARSASLYDWDYGFTGRQVGSQDGLQHNRRRDYHAAMGLFLSPDPLGYAAGEPSLRVYASNRPLDGQDPFGLAWWPPTSWSWWPVWLGGRGDAKDPREESKEVRDLVDKLKAIKDTKDFLDALKKGGLLNPKDLLSTLTDQQTGHIVDALATFADSSACGKWYKEAYIAILNASKGTGSCDSIRSPDAAGAAPVYDSYNQCLWEISMASHGRSGPLFKEFAQNLYDKCKKIADKAKEDPCPKSIGSR